MSCIAWGILAWACVGADAPDPPATKATYTVRIVRTGATPVGLRGRDIHLVTAEPEQISYEVRVITTPAVAWREAFYRHCKRVGREGRSTVWTVDERTAAELLASQVHTKSAVVQMAPKVTAFADATATVVARTRAAFCVDVDRVADGPADHAGAIAFKPSSEVVDDGVTVAIKGRQMADGVRAHVTAESAWVSHVATATTRETIENKQFGKTSVSTSIELPQVVEAKVDGDYEIPARGQMLVSLGTATTVDSHDKPVVMERLLMIAARPIVTEAEEVRVGRKPADPAVRAASMETFVANRAYADVMASVKEDAAPVRMLWSCDASLDALATIGRLKAADPAPKRMPPLPSRTPLQPVGPDGKVVELPPLPEGFEPPADILELSAAPQASPQMRAVRPAMGLSDAEVAPARIEPEPVGRAAIRLDGRELASGRTQVMRIPLGGMLAIEVQARVVPVERPE